VWSLWNNCLFLNDTVDLYGHNETAEKFIFMNVFATVFALAGIAASSVKGIDVVSALIYLLGRIIVTILVQVETSGPRNDRVDVAHNKMFKAAYHIHRMMVPLECFPLLIAVVCCRNERFGILLGGYISCSFFLVWRSYLARHADSILSVGADNDPEGIFDLSYIRGRYEVITLAVLGGFFFVDQAGGQGERVSFWALVTAMGAFLLYYQALERTSGSFVASTKGSSHFSNVHVLVFCVISAMDVAFSQVSLERTTKIEWKVDP